MKRDIHYIVVHCTATPPETTIESIKRYWREELHWKNPGYHYIIQRSGRIETLLLEEQIANGVKGYNKISIHISYVGGVDRHDNPVDNRTAEQVQAMITKLTELKSKYPKAVILGHRDFPGVTKKCPSFDVRQWLKVYAPEFINPA
jgi:N-acetylmuramoyl-L-alanine amidase